MILTLLLAPVEAPSEPPPWWFTASIIGAIFAAALFMMWLAMKKKKPKSRASCPTCGERVGTGWMLCPSCGTNLRGGAPAGVVASAEPKPASTGAALLEFVTGPLQGQRFPLSGEVTTIGSADGNSIVLQDNGVSRKHAGIRKVGGGYELADLGSTNGVYVNNERSARRKLEPGDKIRIGTSEARFNT